MTRDWIFKYRPDRVDVNILIPFPGTPIDRMKHDDKYDVTWKESLSEEFYYKGKRGDAIGIVSTSSLTAQQIKDFRNELVRDIQREGIGMAITDKLVEVEHA